MPILKVNFCSEFLWPLVNIALMKGMSADRHNPPLCFNEELMLKTLAFQNFATIVNVLLSTSH